MKRGVFLKSLSSYWPLLNEHEKSCLFGMCCGAFRRQSTLNSYQASYFLAEISSMVFQMSDDTFLAYVEEAKAFYPTDLYDEMTDNTGRKDEVNDGSSDKSQTIITLPPHAVASSAQNSRKRKSSLKLKRKQKIIKSEPPTVKDLIGETIQKVLNDCHLSKKGQVNSPSSKLHDACEAHDAGIEEKKVEGKTIKSQSKSNEQKQELLFSMISRKFCEIMEKKSSNAFLKQVCEDYRNFKKKRSHEHNVSDVFTTVHSPKSNKFAKVEVAQVH